ncbi:hypothetical protein B1689_16745 [Geobacillus sp. 44C]|nr:hypothetical protein B1689_16745 [Geobacillus sp. 44C]
MPWPHILFIPDAHLGSVFIKEICDFVDNGYRAYVYNSCFHSESRQETSVAYRAAACAFSGSLKNKGWERRK